MKTILITMLITGSVTLSIARSQDLPIRAQDLANKLQEWETVETENLKKRIQEKRNQVRTALEKHLEQATKSGDLDGALAIRNYIASLSLDAPKIQPDHDENQDGTVDTKKSLVGTIWKMNSDRGIMTFEFISEFDAVWTHGDYKGNRVWKLVKDGEIESAPNSKMLGKDIRFTFDLERGTAKTLLRRLGPSGVEVDAKLER